MCGIAGIYGGRPRRQDLLRMSRLQSHRGPDGEGYHLDDEVGLAHRRLSIIDLSAAGANPMYNEEGDLALVFNGEIYNFRELRAELEAKGHRFRSRTDTEVVVHAHEEWGEGAVESQSA
jgi:asparagine synthase (glutamine-hydrolysing)